MMHLAPELTGDDLRADGPGPANLPPPGWSLEGEAPCAWLSRELSGSGVVGDPSGASGELGGELFSRLVRGWRKRLESLVRSDWPPVPGQR
jgi:creatinine amidohydrolase